MDEARKYHRQPVGHLATPGFLFTGNTGRTERCVAIADDGRRCLRWLRSSPTSPTGWRHAGKRA